MEDSLLLPFHQDKVAPPVVVQGGLNQSHVFIVNTVSNGTDPLLFGSVMFFYKIWLEPGW